MDTLKKISAALRMWPWSLAAIILFVVIGVFAPTQLPVVIYKAAMVSLFGVIGYWLDRSLFGYARPHDFFGEGQHTVGALLMLRRAAIILACILGGTLGV